jgi:hypothetical protein
LEILSFPLLRLPEILRLHSIRFSHEPIDDRALSLEYASAPFRFLDLDRSWLTLFAGIALTGLVTFLCDFLAEPTVATQLCAVVMTIERPV